MFEKLIKFLTDFQVGVKNVWDCLPKEVRVGIYLFTSLLIAQVIEQLKIVKVDNTLLTMLINVVIVFFTQVPSRIKAIRDQK